MPEAGTRFDVQLGRRLQVPAARTATTSSRRSTGRASRARVDDRASRSLGGDTFVRPDLLGYHVSRSAWAARGCSSRAARRPSLARRWPRTTSGWRATTTSTSSSRSSARSRWTTPSASAATAATPSARASLFGSVEFRLPVLLDLQTTVLGLVRFGRRRPVPVRRRRARLDRRRPRQRRPPRRRGRRADERRLRSAASSCGTPSGSATPASRLDDVLDGSLAFDDLDLYYRIQAAVPF